MANKANSLGRQKAPLLVPRRSAFAAGDLRRYVKYVMKTVAIFIIFIFVTLFISAPESFAKKWVEIEKITNNNEIVYRVYIPDKSKKIKLTNIEIWNKVIDNPYEIKVIFRNVPDFKLFLLEQGYARLIDIEQAASKYQLAQKEAKIKKKGLWKERNGKDNIPPAPADSSLKDRSFLNSLNKKFRNIFILLINYIILLWKWILSVGLFEVGPFFRQQVLFAFAV